MTYTPEQVAALIEEARDVGDKRRKMWPPPLVTAALIRRLADALEAEHERAEQGTFVSRQVYADLLAEREGQADAHDHGRQSTAGGENEAMTFQIEEVTGYRWHCRACGESGYIEASVSLAEDDSSTHECHMPPAAGGMWRSLQAHEHMTHGPNHATAGPDRPDGSEEL